MKTFITCLAPATAILLLGTVSAHAMDDHVVNHAANDHSAEDHTLLTGVTLDQLELRDADNGTSTAWDGQLWLGDDLNRLLLNGKGEYLHSNRDHASRDHGGGTDEAELQLLYSRAISAYWDVHAGWRGDVQPTPERQWLALGIAGMAPYFVDVNTTLFLGNEERSALRLELEYEMLFTQRLALIPALELNAYGRDDPETGTGAGVSDLEAGLRLRYEVTREFAPYVGVHYWRQYGNTADFSHAEGEDSDGIAAVAGVHVWF